jgi:hypothetical protein
MSGRNRFFPRSVAENTYGVSSIILKMGVGDADTVWQDGARLPIALSLPRSFAHVQLVMRKRYYRARKRQKVQGPSSRTC